MAEIDRGPRLTTETGRSLHTALAGVAIAKEKDSKSATSGNPVTTPNQTIAVERLLGVLVTEEAVQHLLARTAAEPAQSVGGDMQPGVAVAPRAIAASNQA